MQRNSKYRKSTPVISWEAGLLALAMLVPGASSVMAQEGSCPASLSVGLENEQAFYSLGENIGIILNLSLNFFGDGKGYVDIGNFKYFLDCNEGDTLETCTSAGNTVVFDPDSPPTGVWTNCLDTNGADADPPTLQWTNDGLLVDFTVDDGADDAIRIPSPANFGDNAETCQVGFDVRVDALAASNQSRDILELTGWFGSDAAVCSNQVPSARVEQSVRLSIANEFARFWVTKDFSDDNPDEVNVKLRCNTGLPLEQEFLITDPATGGTFPGVGFVVYALPQGGADCQIWEDPVPGGYAESYEADTGEGAIYDEVFDNEDGCFYEGAAGGDFTCEVTDSLEEAMVTVNKQWLGDVLNNDVALIASVDWRCYNVRKNAAGDLTEVNGGYVFEGEEDSFDIMGIYPDFGGTSYCTVLELNTDSAVESDTSECERVAVPLGANPTPSCTIYNTAFFEGIPTLSRHAIALMVLLTLGVGLIALRRIG